MSRPDPFGFRRVTNPDDPLFQLAPPSPPMMIAHQPAPPPGYTPPAPMVSHAPMQSVMDPAIREAQARINAASRPNPQPLGPFNDPQSMVGQFADVGHELIKNFSQQVSGHDPMGPESPGAYRTVDLVKEQGFDPGLLQRLGVGRFSTQPAEQEAIAMPVLKGPNPVPEGPLGEAALGEAAQAAADKAAKIAKNEGLTRAYQRMKQYMRPDLADNLGPTLERNIAQAFKGLPSPEEYEAAARAGIAKKGWYKNSGAAIKTVFGDDTPTFTGVLAAMSPQQSVSANLDMAIHFFGKWIAAGRPEDEAGILKVLDSVPKGSFEAYRNNTVRAIQGNPLVDWLGTGKDAGSGYKVESFRQNLLGEMDYSTNDTWVQKFIGKLSDSYFGSKGRYLASDARTRQVAQQMGWSVAEVQETVWSWIKTLLEQTPSNVKLEEGLKGLSHELIGQDADFAQLLRDPKIVQRLSEYGYEPPSAAFAARSAASSQANIAGAKEADPDVLSRITRRLTKAGIKPEGAARK